VEEEDLGQGVPPKRGQNIISGVREGCKGWGKRKGKAFLAKIKRDADKGANSVRPGRFDRIGSSPVPFSPTGKRDSGVSAVGAKN